MFSLFVCGIAGVLMRLLRGLLFSVFLLFLTQNSEASAVYRDHPGVLQPAAGELEVSAELFGMNDTLDLFNFRESEYVCPGCTPEMSFGDTEGAGLLLNYGLFDQLSVQASYRRWAVENAFGRLVMDSGDTALRFRPVDSVVVQCGVRGNRSADFSVAGADQIDILFRYLLADSALTFTNGYSHYIVSNGNTSVSISKADDPLRIHFSQMWDMTPYVRLIAGGEILPGWQGSLFAEGGKSWIDTEISLLIDPSLSGMVPTFEGDLERQEHYVKAGFDLSTKLEGANWNLNGYLVRLQRDAGLDYVDFNRVLQGEVGFPLTDHLQIFLSGTWYRRQFNGEVPFAYNRYSQTTYDHDYGLVHAGVVFAY